MERRRRQWPKNYDNRTGQDMITFHTTTGKQVQVHKREVRQIERDSTGDVRFQGLVHRCQNEARSEWTSDTCTFRLHLFIGFRPISRQQFDLGSAGHENATAVSNSTYVWSSWKAVIIFQSHFSHILPEKSDTLLHPVCFQPAVGLSRFSVS